MKPEKKKEKEKQIWLNPNQILEKAQKVCVERFEFQDKYDESRWSNY